MDASKSASAPAMESSMVGQFSTPSYNDNVNRGYPQPGPAYPPQMLHGYPVVPTYGGALYGQRHYPQPAIITAHPAVYVTDGQPPVPDYLCYSIFTMLCCCLPLGVAALIYSIAAREANHTGDRLVAERNSRTARTLNHVALGLGLGITVFFIAYIIVMVASVYH